MRRRAPSSSARRTPISGGLPYLHEVLADPEPWTSRALGAQCAAPWPRVRHGAPRRQRHVAGFSNPPSFCVSSAAPVAGPGAGLPRPPFQTPLSPARWPHAQDAAPCSRRSCPDPRAPLPSTSRADLSPSPHAQLQVDPHRLPPNLGNPVSPPSTRFDSVRGVFKDLGALWRRRPVFGRDYVFQPCLPGSTPGHENHRNPPRFLKDRSLEHRSRAFAHGPTSPGGRQRAAFTSGATFPGASSISSGRSRGGVSVEVRWSARWLAFS